MFVDYFPEEFSYRIFLKHSIHKLWLLFYLVTGGKTAFSAKQAKNTSTHGHCCTYNNII